MNVAYINPFIESALAFFGKMLGCAVERQPPGVTREAPKPSEITALIGIGGPIRGTVVLAFPPHTALAIVEKLTGVKTKVVDEAVCDAVAEAVNIVAGGAKAKLVAEGETPATLSLPSVVRGGDYMVTGPSNTTWLDIPFHSDLGPFRLRVTLESSPSGGKR